MKELKEFAIPENWEWVRLNDYLDVRDGTHDTPKYYNNGYPLVTSKNLSSGKLDLTNVKLISEADYVKIKERSKVDYEDILFAMIGSIGNPVIVDINPEFAIKNVALFKYFDRKLSCPKFIKVFLELTSNIMKDKAQGGVQSFVSLGFLRNYLMPLPPLAEQNRIVAKVDELMVLCNKLEQEQMNHIETHLKLVEALLQPLTDAKNAEELKAAWQHLEPNFDILFTTEESVELLKQTVLQLAVMGKLVPQDPNDEPASVLLEKIAAEKRRLIKEGKLKKQKPLPEIAEEEKPFELPDGWEWSRLGNFTRVGTGSTPSRTNSEYYYPAEINWVTSGATNQDFIYDTDEKISVLALKKTNVSVYPVGSLIIAMYGQGKTRGQVSELKIKAGTNQACAAVVFINQNDFHRRYIKYYFRKAYEEIRNEAAGGAQPNLNLGKVTNTVIPIPPLREQIRIVDKIDELMSLCDQLNERIIATQELKVKLADAVVEQAAKTKPGKVYEVTNSLDMAAEPGK